MEAEVSRDPALEVGQPRLVAVEQVEHVLGGAHRTLDAAQRIAIQQLLEPLDRDQHLVGDGGEPFAERGGLGRDVVGPAGHHRGLVLGGEPGQPSKRGDRAVPEQRQRLADLELLDVLGEVPRGHPLVDVLVAGQRVELLDPRLHVVPGDPLAGRDRVEVDLVDDVAVVGHHPVGNGDAQVALYLEHGDPQPALEHDLVLRRPDPGEVGPGVPGCQDIRHSHVRDGHLTPGLPSTRCRCGAGRPRILRRRHPCTPRRERPRDPHRCR